MNLKNLTSELKITAAVWVLFLFFVGYFLYTTTPDSIGPEGITVFFVTLYFLMASSIHLLVLLVRKYLLRRSEKRSWRLGYSVVFGFVPVTILGLQSLDQLVLRDVVIFFGIVSLIVFFLSKK